MLIAYVFVAFFFREADVVWQWWFAFWVAAFIDFVRSVK